MMSRTWFLGDNSTDYRRSPIIIRGNQSSCAIVQFQGGISQCIGNIIWRCTELRAYGTNNHPLCARSLNDKTANHDVVTSLHKAASADIAKNGSSVSAKIVHFHETDSSGVIYATHNRGVVPRWQICNDRRFEWICRSVAAVLNIGDLVPCDNAADYRMLPVIIRANQRSSRVVQFQCRISQCVGNVIWRCTELRANGANNDSLWSGSLDDEAANHHVVARLDKRPRTDVA